MKKRTHSSMLTQQGYVDLKCPECDGEGVDLIDNTHARGGEMLPQLCGYCDGSGNIDENKVLDVKFDDEGKPLLIYKEI